MMRPTVNQLWVERELQWCEETNPFCFDLFDDDEEDPMAMECLLASGWKSPCPAVGQQHTPPAPRSGVLHSTKLHVAEFDQLLTDIKRERDGAYQRARSAIDRIGVRTSKTSADAVIDMQSHSNIKDHRLSLPPGAISRSPSSINAHQAQQQRQMPMASAPSLPAKISAGDLASSSAGIKSGRKADVLPSPVARTNGDKNIAVLPPPPASPFTGRRDGQEARPDFAATPRTPQIKGNPDWLSKPLFPASELPRCFTQSAAHLHERLKSRGIFVTGSNLPARAAVAAAH
mmetsp:Transcript_94157/g.177066  ORF Transcript_94157/g.177066 Transcript_94157/m.177066 type:complete len:288 (+) Transcript_94157:85-948(+)